MISKCDDILSHFPLLTITVSGERDPLWWIYDVFYEVQ